MKNLRKEANPNGTGLGKTISGDKIIEQFLNDKNNPATVGSIYFQAPSSNK